MLRIAHVSDIHQEKHPKERLSALTFANRSVDVLVITGDTDFYKRTVDTISRLAPDDIPEIVFVAGNHEYFDGEETVERSNISLNLDVRKWNRDNKSRRMTFLNNSEFTIIKGDERYVFLGGTLWGSETEVNGSLPREGDFSRIKKNNLSVALARYKKAESYIYSCLNKYNSDPSVIPIVVTHYPPFNKCQVREFRKELYKSPFAGDMEGVTEKYDFPLWLYGHAHGGMTVNKGGTTFVCSSVGPDVKNPIRRPKIIELSKDGLFIEEVSTVVEYS